MLLGKITAQGMLYSARENKKLAQINRESEELLLPVSINNKRVGSITNASRKDRNNPRAFQYLSDMSKEEEKLFLALSILEMAKRDM